MIGLFRMAGHADDLQIVKVVAPAVSSSSVMVYVIAKLIATRPAQVACSPLLLLDNMILRVT